MLEEGFSKVPKKSSEEEKRELLEIAHSAMQNAQNKEVGLDDFPNLMSEHPEFVELEDKLLTMRTALAKMNGMVAEDLYRNIFSDAEKLKSHLEDELLKNEYAEQSVEYQAKIQMLHSMQEWLNKSEVVPGNKEELEKKIQTLEEVLNLTNPNLN